MSSPTEATARGQPDEPPEQGVDEGKETEHLFDDDIEMDEPRNADETEQPEVVQEDEVDPSQSLEEPDGDDDTLFINIFTTPASVPGLVAPWMTYVRTNGPAAVASILSLVVNMSRAVETPPPDVIPAEAVVANDPVTTVAEIRDIIAADRHGRVLVTAKDTASRRMRRAYEDFWRRIAAEAVDVVLYDTDCFDTLITWLDAMTASPSRSLRLAACLGAYRMVDGLIEKGNKIRKQLASMQRQLNTEKRRCGVDDKKRKAGKQLSKKGKELAKKVDELTANNSDLIELSDKVFRSLFIVKYRDVSPDIRNASVAALGGWILSFPDHFLDDSNNKYIGWLLSDKDSVVRKSSLDALVRMLKKKDFFASLELFLKRFSNRITEMTRDKDDQVSVGAISLLTCLIDHGIVENEACEQVCETAIDEPHQEIRRAAGEFMARLITRHYGNVGETSPPKRRRAGRASDGIFNAGLGEIPSVEQSREYIKELLFAVLRKADEKSTPFLAVDAVWDSFPAVRCWEAYSELLLEKVDIAPAKGRGKGKGSKKGKQPATEDEDGLNDFDKSILCEMLLASAKEAKGNGDPVRARLVERGERLNPEPPAVLLSQHFLPLLSKLLSQFQTDPRALSALIKLPTHFSPKVFDQDGQDTHFTSLLTKIVDVLTRNTGSPEISSACAETLRALLSDDNPLKQRAITALQDGCAKAAKELTLQVRSDLSDAQPEEIASAILRVRILSELVDPGSSPEESVLKLFQYQVENPETSTLGDEVTMDAARTASALVIWSLARVRSRMESFRDSEDGVDGIHELEEVKDIRRLGSSVVDLLHSAFAADSQPITARINFLQAFLTMSTLARGIEKVVLFSAPEKQTSDETQSSREELDILHMKDKVLAILPGLKKCILDLMEHQLELQNHNQISSEEQRSKINLLPDEEVRDCFASLVQASFQSAFSNEISHLPLLGLLLKRNHHQVESTVTDFTALHLCRRYCQQRQLRESSLTKDEVRALRQVAKFKSDEDQRLRLIRELVDMLMSSRQHGELKIAAARDLLNALMKHALDAEAELFLSNVDILSNAGFGVYNYLSQPHASKLLDLSESIRKKLHEATLGDEDSSQEDTYELFHRALQAISNGESPDIPKLRTKTAPQRKKKRTKKRRRTSVGAVRQLRASTVENQGVRRSSREKKQIDYARMQYLQTSSESESDEVQSSDDEQGTPQLTKSPKPQDAAEMARNLMRYGNSPRPRARDSPKAIREASNARKRGRPSTRKQVPTTGSPSEGTTDSLRRDSTSAGVRRSSRMKKSSEKVIASHPRKATTSNSHEVSNDDTTKDSGSLETNRSMEKNTTAQEGNEASKSNETEEADNSSEGPDTSKEKDDDGGGTNDKSDEEKESPVRSGKSLREDVSEQRVMSPGDQVQSEPQSGISSSSVSGQHNESSEAPHTPQRAQKSTSKNSATPRRSPPRRSPRKHSSFSDGSSKARSPAKGRIQKSPKRAKGGKPDSDLQENKENVNGSPQKVDVGSSKLAKIRRRRRQW